VRGDGKQRSSRKREKQIIKLKNKTKQRNKQKSFKDINRERQCTNQP
jgi:hypothetical protein